MQRTNFGELACSIARTLDVIGEPWSPLILRDVWVGFTRFEQIQADLGISRKVLTDKGNELVDMLIVMVGWADKWLAGKAGPPALYRHRACGEISHADLRCAHCGQPMHADDVELLPGRGAAA